MICRHTHTWLRYRASHDGTQRGMLCRVLRGSNTGRPIIPKHLQPIGCAEEGRACFLGSEPSNPARRYVPGFPPQPTLQRWLDRLDSIVTVEPYDVRDAPLQPCYPCSLAPLGAIKPRNQSPYAPYFTHRLPGRPRSDGSQRIVCDHLEEMAHGTGSRSPGQVTSLRTFVRVTAGQQL